MLRRIRNSSLKIAPQFASSPAGEVNGAKATQGTLAGVLVGTALSVGVTAVKATFVAGVVAAFVSLVPILGNIDVDDKLAKEGKS